MLTKLDLKFRDKEWSFGDKILNLKKKLKILK